MNGSQTISKDIVPNWDKQWDILYQSFEFISERGRKGLIKKFFSQQIF